MSRRTPHDPEPVDRTPAFADGSSVPRDPPSVSESQGGLRTLGRFELIRLLERAPYGVTRYQARDPYLDRPVIVTICPGALPGGRARLEMLLRAATSTGDRALDRFLYEARLLARLHHPAIPPVYELGQVDNLPYMVSPFVEGRSFLTVCGTGAPPAEAARLLAELAEALHYVHEQGLVHRHVRPGILRVDEQGRPHLTDFGQARLLTDETPAPQDDEVWGNLAYVSPEVIEDRGSQIDGRCDVYSLGVVLYQALTGRLPFPGPSAVHAVRHKLGEEPEPPQAIDRRVDRVLETICLTALAREPEGRYPTAAALGADLRRFLARPQPRGRPTRWLAWLWPWSRRRTIKRGASAEKATRS